jgi:hypothetical protein
MRPLSVDLGFPFSTRSEFARHHQAVGKAEGKAGIGVSRSRDTDPGHRSLGLSYAARRLLWMKTGRLVVLGASIALAAAGCGSHPVQGSGLLLNVQPTPPAFAGAYDFDLLGPARGTACLKKQDRQLGGTKIIYWVSGAAFEKLPGGSLASNAIAAAAFKVIDESNADSVVMTRVIVESKGEDEVCATLYGRAIRLKKAKPTLPVREAVDDSPAEDDDADGSE